MRAQGRIRYPLGIKREDEVVSKAHALIGEYPDVFSTPVDIAIDKDGDRVEMDVRELESGDKIYDLGPKTVEHYSKLIAGAGTLTTLLSLRAEFELINIIIAILVNILFVYLVLKFSEKIERIFGKSGIGVIRKIFGVILMAIAVKLFASNIQGLF